MILNPQDGVVYWVVLALPTDKHGFPRPPWCGRLDKSTVKWTVTKCDPVNNRPDDPKVVVPVSSELHLFASESEAWAEYRYRSAETANQLRAEARVWDAEAQTPEEEFDYQKWKKGPVGWFFTAALHAMPVAAKERFLTVWDKAKRTPMAVELYIGGQRIPFVAAVHRLAEEYERQILAHRHLLDRKVAEIEETAEVKARQSGYAMIKVHMEGLMESVANSIEDALDQTRAWLEVDLADDDDDDLDSEIVVADATTRDDDAAAAQATKAAAKTDPTHASAPVTFGAADFDPTVRDEVAFSYDG